MHLLLFWLICIMGIYYYKSKFNLKNMLPGIGHPWSPKCLEEALLLERGPENSWRKEQAVLYNYALTMWCEGQSWRPGTDEECISLSLFGCGPEVIKCQPLVRIWICFAGGWWIYHPTVLKIGISAQAGWCMLIISALLEAEAGDHKFKSCLGNLVRSCPKIKHENGQEM